MSVCLGGGHINTGVVAKGYHCCRLEFMMARGESLVVGWPPFVGDDDGGKVLTVKDVYHLMKST